MFNRVFDGNCLLGMIIAGDSFKFDQGNNLINEMILVILRITELLTYRAFNNTGKEYWQYQCLLIKVLAIPIPMLIN